MHGSHDRLPNPAAEKNGEYCLTIAAECRLDNREDLKSRLGIDGASAANLTDTELILAAYRIWGTQTPEFLLGDFAFAIGDNRGNSIFCARDHLGIVPFYYDLSATTFAYGTSVREAVVGRKSDPEPCEPAIAIYLRDGELYHDRLTFIEGVKKLPPGHALLITGEEHSEWCYWRPEESPCIRYGSREESVAHLKQLLAEVVRCRIPEGQPVGLHLSGGLDSSALTALAATKITAKSGRLAAFSWMSPPDSAEQANEPEWATGRIVAERYDIPISYEKFGSDELLHILETHNIASGDTVDCWYEFGVREKAAAGNVKTLITGWGGDQFISHHGSRSYFEAFWRGRIVPILSHFWQVSSSAESRFRGFSQLVFYQLIQPWTERWFRRPRQRLEYLDTATDQLVSQADALPREFIQYSHRSVRGQQLGKNERLHLNSRLEGWGASGRKAGIEYRYPLLDKRVVEFALGIPPELYRREGTTRYIFREAVKELLPEQVWSGPKAGTEPARLQKAMEICFEALLRWNRKHGGEIADHPYIDGNKLKSLLSDIATREPVMDIDTYRAVATAIKSILVLNMSLEPSRL